MSQNELDKAVYAAWKQRMEDGRQQPWLASIRVRYGDSLLTRFQNYYKSLWSLPRRIRRFLRRKFSMSLGMVALLMTLSFVPPDVTVKSSVITGDSQIFQAQSYNGRGVYENNIQRQGLTLQSTIVVNGNNPATNCTLDDAIIAANTNSTSGNCIAGTGDDIIDIQVNVNLTAPAPIISSKMTLEGNGNSIAGDDTFGPLLHVNATGDLTLNNATVSNGKHITYGGGIGIFNGSASINDSTISYNHANYGGGGVANWYGTLAMSNTKVLYNSSVRGAGIVNIGGDAIIINSEISENTATVYGGGIRNSSQGNLHLIDCTISGNSAPNSAGIFNWESSYLLVENSTISDNNAMYSHGGIYNARGAELIVNNSTISGNIGIGIWAGSTMGLPPQTTINDSTISGNSFISGPGAGVWINSGQASINRSLISNNTGAGYANDVYNTGSLTVDNYNIFGHDGLTTAESIGGFTPGITDILATSDGTLPTPLAGILNTNLQNNGGSTNTHALSPGSPAVDGVADGSCAAGMEDQRHFPRGSGQGMGGPLCDIGAFEVQTTDTIVKVFMPTVLNADTAQSASHAAQAESSSAFPFMGLLLGLFTVSPLGFLKNTLSRKA